jgi:hypothetical protein
MAALDESMAEKGLLGSNISMVEEPMMLRDHPEPVQVPKERRGTFIGSPTKGELEMENKRSSTLKMQK